MRKLILFPLSLLVFACSQQEDTIINDSPSKKTNTDDTTIGYRSPYNNFQLRNDEMSYKFINGTSLTFKIKANFGLAFYDGQDDLLYNTLNSTTNYSTDIFPNLARDHREYGNYIEAEEITVLPNYSFKATSTDFVPSTPTQITPNNPNGFHFNLLHNNTNRFEEDIITRHGKLHFIKFEALDGRTRVPNSKSIVKTFFPEGIYTINNVLPSGWKTLQNDNIFNEEIIYNEETKEICITSQEKSKYKTYYTFSYQDKTYKVRTELDDYMVVIYLEEI